MNNNYIYGTQRQGGLLDNKAWYKGESEYLKKLIGAGFYNSLYICEDGLVISYYLEDEIKKFDEALEQMSEAKFNNVCDDFMQLINKMSDCKTDKEKLELFSKMTPALTIFFEFDNCPEYMNEDMARRLMRVRTNTESKPYEFLKNVGDNEPKDFILYKGKVYLK